MERRPLGKPTDWQLTGNSTLYPVHPRDFRGQSWEKGKSDLVSGLIISSITLQPSAIPQEWVSQTLVGYYPVCSVLRNQTVGLNNRRQNAEVEVGNVVYTKLRIELP